MDNVVSLSGQRITTERRANDALVAALRELLAKAETGELTALVGAVQTAGDGIGYVLVGQMNALTVVGALEVVKLNLIAECEDGE